MSLTLNVEQLQVIGSNRRTLLSVDQLSVAAGSCLCVRGPSGAGKSTFLFALAGLIDQARGQVSWGGTELLGLNRRKRCAFRRQHIGQIFQDFLLFDEMSAQANAHLCRTFADASQRADIENRASLLLERLGLSDTHDRNMGSYSGGERQRVAIARAIAVNPDVILADEPTASLDREAADNLVNDLLALVRSEHKSLLVVSHDPHLQSRMDRLLTMVDGRFVEDTGPPSPQ